MSDIDAEGVISIYAWPDWTDEDFTAVLHHHGLWDSTICDWDYRIATPPCGDRVEIWTVAQ